MRCASQVYLRNLVFIEREQVYHFWQRSLAHPSGSFLASEFRNGNDSACN